MLPGDTPNREEGEWNVMEVDGLIEHGEPELAVDALTYIGDALEEYGQEVPADFWRLLAEVGDSLENP